LRTVDAYPDPDIYPDILSRFDASDRHFRPVPTASCVATPIPTTRQPSLQVHLPPKIIDNPTAEDIIKADQERCAWATRAGNAIAGPEPCQVYRPFFWMLWANRFGEAAEAAFRRVN
jgi:hypothetical protein